MSVAGSLALAVAERVERTAGTRAGLLAYRTLAGNTADVEVRGRALLAALRCAIELTDRSAVNELVGLWKNVDRGVWDRPVLDLCKAMARVGLWTSAIDLAQIEAHLRRSARILYLHARCLELGRAERGPRTITDDAIVAVLEDAIRRAENEGASDVEEAARARRAAILSRSLATRSTALDEAKRLEASPHAAIRFQASRILLRSPSRFVRASAIDALDALVTSGGSLGARALRLAASFADERALGLTRLELDRLGALFRRPEAAQRAPLAPAALEHLGQIAIAADEAARERALATAAATDPALARLHARARDLVRGRFAAAATSGGPPDGEEALLDLAYDLRDGRADRAVTGLRALRDAVAGAGARPLPAAVVAIGERGLASSAGPVQAAAAALFDAILERPSLPHFPRGFLGLGNALLAAGFADTALRARRAAVLAREPGASDVLGTMLTRAGWELARSGERAAAIAKLREAKRAMAQ